MQIKRYADAYSCLELENKELKSEISKVRHNFLNSTDAGLDTTIKTKSGLFGNHFKKQNSILKEENEKLRNTVRDLQYEVT